MSVLNQASDGLFNVLIVLVRVLVRLGPRSREDLLRACGAEVDDVDSGHLTRTLNRWIELGLFGVENDAIGLLEPYRSILGKSADTAEVRLPKVARTVAMLPQNNLRFWESEEAKSADLSRGVAWVLAQDIYTLNPSTERLAELETLQLTDPGRPILQNNGRRSELRTWMSYLGFAREGSQWTVDPTDALRESLADIFDRGQELTAPDFVERTATILPVMDGGSYRRQVEAALNDAAWTRLRPGMLSTSLSRAIQRLEREGQIRVEQKSDAEGSLTLTGYDRRPWREITHLSLRPVERAR